LSEHRKCIERTLLTDTRLYLQGIIDDHLQVVVHHLLLLHLDQLAPEEVLVSPILLYSLLIRNRVAALLDEECELLLVEAHLVGEEKLRLGARLDDVPEGLYGVELWRVAGLKDQRHVEIFCLLLDSLGHVAPVVVDHNM